MTKLRVFTHKSWNCALLFAALCSAGRTPVFAQETAALLQAGKPALDQEFLGAADGGAMVTSTVRLDEIIDGESDWKFAAAGKGSKATLEVVKDQPEKGQFALRFAAELADDKSSARLVKYLKDLELTDIKAIRMKVKSETVTGFGIVLVDGTGQTHQKKGNKLEADNKWHDLVIDPLKIAGGEHWGGANDGKWHGAPASIAITFNIGSDKVGKKPALSLADIRADAVQAGVAQAASFKSDFEKAGVLNDWKVEGTVALDTTAAFKGANALVISRTTNGREAPASASSPAFPLTPGQWQFSLASKSDLKSPDSSYSGTVNLDLLDGNGKQVDSTILVDVFGTRPWTPVSKAMTVPTGVTQGRFRVQLNKADGKLWIDELAASFLTAPVRRDNRIARLTFQTVGVANMLLPTDPKTVTVTVLATKPLLPEQLTVTYEIRDYWGAEQAKAGTVKITRAEKKLNDNFVYSGTADLAPLGLEIGRYYEIHGSVPQVGGEALKNYTSLVIVPEAVTKKYKPEEIPFTSRSWDNRSPMHILTGDRLGIRIAGVKASWKQAKPWKASAPRLDMVKQLGMGWLTTTPVATVERGLGLYTDEALREGIKNLLTQYGDTRPLYINIGNEPHGTGDVVKRNVAAYKLMYEEVKKIDPTITVIATSVEPNEEYFKAGYGKYCDAYDFHVYETPEGIRRNIEEYKVLMKKYDVVHPIWSTEIGLNAQGLPTYTIAGDMIRKVTTFFAAGGANVSWFGLTYSDPTGRGAGTSGEAHNIFYGRYNLYAPKMQAVSYYNIINAISIKKFVAEKKYENGVSAFLFRDKDGKSLQVLWKDKGRSDVSVPLAGVQSARAIRLDGSNRTLEAGGKAVTLTVNEDPLLLLYDGGASTLPAALGEPLASLENVPASILRSGTATISTVLNGVAPDAVNLVVPAGWTAKKTTSDAKTVSFALSGPTNSEIRQADLTLQINQNGKRAGELYARAPVAGLLAMQLTPIAAQGDKPAGIKFSVTNNGTKTEQLSWDLSLDRERALAKGIFGPLADTTAHFTEAPSGSLSIESGKTATVSAPLSDIDPLKLYRVRALISDATGRSSTVERLVGGFVPVPKTGTAPKLDGVLDEAVWKIAPVQTLDKEDQMRLFREAQPWKGAADLSAKLQYAWDDKYLYVAADVTDDAVGALQMDNEIWRQDSIQFLIDPSHDALEKTGKYDISVGVGAKGPQAWAALSADTSIPTGEVKEIVIGAKKGAGGSQTYEIAIPWTRLAPFKPQVGADLGLTLALNEDDGKGRRSFMTWFGDVHDKQVDLVADLILSE
jgi:hypothetical protein